MFECAGFKNFSRVKDMLMSLHNGEIKEIPDDKELTRRNNDLNAEGTITYLNLKKNAFNDDCHHLLQILTPLSLNRFHLMCFQEHAPYSFGYWMELQGRNEVKVNKWTQKDGQLLRDFSFVVKGGSWLSKTVEVKVKGSQSYTHDA